MPDPTAPGGADPAALYPAAPPTTPPSSPPPRLPPVGSQGPPWPYDRSWSRRRRTAIGMVLLFLAGLSVVGSVAAAWTRAQIRDEDNWAATAEALADDPQVQVVVADTLTAQVIAVTGADDIISGLLPGPLGALADPLTDQATELVNGVALQLVQTDAFRSAWEAAVRSSHEELLAALDGNGRYTSISPQGIELELGSTLAQFRQMLDDKGLTFLDGIDLSGIDVQFLLIDAPGVQKLRDTLEVLDGLVMVLPLVAVVTGVAGLLIARRRSWALAVGGLAVVLGAASVVVLASAGRYRAEQEFTGGVLGQAAVDVVADQVLSSLERAMGVAAVGGLLVVGVGTSVAVVTARRA